MVSRTISNSLLTVFVASVIVVLGTSLAAAQVPPLYGPADPPPLGVNQSFSNGSPHDGDIGRPGGELGTFWNVQLATMTSVWWAPLADEVKLSLDGSEYNDNEIMDLYGWDRPNGLLEWGGSSILCGTSNNYPTRCYMTVTEDDGVTPIPLVDPASLGLPASVGGLIPVPGPYGFYVHLSMHANGEPYLDFYDYWIDYWHITGCTNQAYSSFDWGYYWLGVYPWLVNNNPLVLDEGAMGTIALSLLLAEDVESPSAEITYTVTAGKAPPANGALLLNNVPLGADDTFTQQDINNGLLMYEHDGGETTSDGFTFTCEDGDGQLVPPPSKNIHQFSITINPVNDIPVALPDSFDVNAGQSFIDTLRAVDPDSPLLYFLTESGELGTAVILDINTGLFEYNADPDTSGVDTVRFQVNDGEYMSNEATVLIRVEEVTAAMETPGNLPQGFALLPATPNPFNPRTDLRYDLPEPAWVNLKIFDATGRLVRTLIRDEQRTAGRHIATWDGRSDHGLALPSGVYLYRMEAGRWNATGKMVMLK
jgi:hypothetical protein